LDGFFLIDKPRGPSSFDIIRMLRRSLVEPTLGHAGTLDPMATGLLIVAAGGATRLLPYLPVDPKRYVFGVRFGAETDTLDLAGKIVHDNGRIPSAGEISAILPDFIGEQMQAPPRYSSLKVKGDRAYKLARENKEFTLRPRSVAIRSLYLDGYDAAAGEARFTATCSTGTYVRSLARDIAHKLGTLGYASFVRRLSIGPFTVDAAVSPDVADIRSRLITIRDAFAAFPSVVLSAQEKRAMTNGHDVPVQDGGDTSLPVFAYDAAGELIAVCSRSAGGIHPRRVFGRTEKASSAESTKV
jgi:tRNA pseudouridine55 synthase